MIKLQEDPIANTVLVSNNILKWCSLLNLPQLSDVNLYIGMPFPKLEQLEDALRIQYEMNSDVSFRNRLRYAGILHERTEHLLQWTDNTYPEMPPGTLEAVLTLDFVRMHRNVFMIGPSGTGKSLLSIILVCKALRLNYSAKYVTAHTMRLALQKTQDSSSLDSYIKRMKSCDLLVIEDLDFATYEDDRSAEAFFAILDGRYQRKSTIVTTNGDYKVWASKLPNPNMGAAVLGRLLEDVLLVNMNGAEDMRLRGMDPKL